jgi:hypothetical protein
MENLAVQINIAFKQLVIEEVVSHNAGPRLNFGREAFFCSFHNVRQVLDNKSQVGV